MESGWKKYRKVSFCFSKVRFIIYIGKGFAGRPTLPIKGNFKRIKKVVTPGSQK